MNANGNDPGVTAKAAKPLRAYLGSRGDCGGAWIAYARCVQSFANTRAPRSKSRRQMVLVAVGAARLLQTNHCRRGGVSNGLP
jgi:hypothetical protein